MVPCFKMFDDKLTGSTFGERRKVFNKLVSAGNIEELSPENVATLTSKSQAMQVYMAALADRLQNEQVVWAVLRSGNLMTIKKVMKYKWFFEKKTTLMNTDYVFREIFPNVSYGVRSKIISRLGIFLKDESMAEEFYIKTCQEYSRVAAESILPACSLSFVKDTLLKIPDFVIQCQTLIKIYKRDPEVAIEFIDKYFSMDRETLFPFSQRENKINFQVFWKQLVQHHPERFIRLYLKYNKIFTVKFGYRNSLSLLKCDLKTIIDNEIFLRILNKEAFHRMVKGENLDKVLLYMRDSEMIWFLKHFKPMEKLSHITKTHATAHYRDLLTTDMIIDMGMAECLNPEVRISWAKKKLAKIRRGEIGISHYYYITYLSTAEAIPRYLRLCEKAPTEDQRLELLEFAVSCCERNSDDAALLNLMRHVSQCHTNDAVKLRCDFLKEVNSLFKLHKLTAPHWEVINEMIQVMFSNNEIEQNHLEEFLRSVLAEYLQYRLDNNMEIDSVIDIMMKYDTGTVNYCCHNMEYERRIMDLFFQRYRILTARKPFGDVFERNVLILLDSYVLWNINHKKHRRSFTECVWLMEILKRWIKKTNSEKVSQSSILSRLQDDLPTRIMLAEEIFNVTTSEKIISNLVKHDIAILLNNMDSFVMRVVHHLSLRKNVRLFHQIRAFMRKPIGDLLKSKLNKLENKPEQDKDKAAVVIALGFLLDIDDFEMLIRGYLPSKTKIDPSAMDGGETEMITVICGLVKCVNPPVSLDILSCLAKDDYFELVLPSLFSIIFKRSSNESYKFVKDLTEQPVSVKKHAIRLAYFFYPKEFLPDFYKTTWEVSKSRFVRQVVIKWTFKYMVAESDLVRYKEIWQILKSFIKGFKNNDESMFKYCYEAISIRPEIADDF